VAGARPRPDSCRRCQVLGSREMCSIGTTLMNPPETLFFFSFAKFAKLPTMSSPASLQVSVATAQSPPLFVPAHSSTASGLRVFPLPSSSRCLARWRQARRRRWRSRRRPWSCRPTPRPPRRPAPRPLRGADKPRPRRRALRCGSRRSRRWAARRWRRPCPGPTTQRQGERRRGCSTGERESGGGGSGSGAAVAAGGGVLLDTNMCFNHFYSRFLPPPPPLYTSALSAVERSLAGLQSECRRLLVLDRGEDARGSSPSSLSYHIPSMFCWLFMVYVR